MFGVSPVFKRYGTASSVHYAACVWQLDYAQHFHRVRARVLFALSARPDWIIWIMLLETDLHTTV